MTIDEKFCKKCQKIQSKNNFQRNKQNPDGLKYSCKSCCKKYVSNNSAKIRDRYLQNKYGITLQKYDEILMKQDGKCSICLSTSTGCKQKNNFCVDHCHETGVVRGLLCDGCSKILGIAKDNIENIGLVAVYLSEKRWENDYETHERIV